MIHHYCIRRHDTAPSLYFIATEPHGAPVDLTAYSAATLTMIKRDAVTPTVSRRAATIVDAANGVLRFDWVAGDTAVPGAYFCEFELTGPNGLKRTFPANSQIRVDVVGDLDNA